MNRIFRYIGIGCVVLMGGAFVLLKDTRGTTPTFGGTPIVLEYALSPEEREKGLGGRDTLKDTEGMLFVFPESKYYGFWMKETHVPLDIFWLDDKGHVLCIHKNVDPSSYPTVFYPSVPARYVLEFTAGFADKNHIEEGAELKLPYFPIVSK